MSHRRSHQLADGRRPGPPMQLQMRAKTLRLWKSDTNGKSGNRNIARRHEIPQNQLGRTEADIEIISNGTVLDGGAKYRIGVCTLPATTVMQRALRQNWKRLRHRSAHCQSTRLESGFVRATERFSSWSTSTSLRSLFVRIYLFHDS